MSIPLLDLNAEYEALKDSIDEAIADCLSSQQWILGPQVTELENSVATMLGSNHCIGTSSGTEALLIALRALAIVKTGNEFFTRDDKFLVPALTFAATGEAVIRAGGTPVILDVRPDTFSICPEAVRSCLENTPGVKGILPVHLYGYPAAMDELMELAEEFSLFVVEDVAQAFGGSFSGKALGSIGDVGALSFFPSKLLGGYGDAGMMSTDDSELARVLRMLIRHGGEDKYDVKHVGYNARLDTIQAAILTVKFKCLDQNRTRRREIAAKYAEGLSDCPLRLPADPLDVHQFHQFTITLDSEDARTSLQSNLKEAGIGSAVYYPVPLHRMDLFKRMGTTFGDLSQSEKLCKTVLSIPIDPYMADGSCEKVISTICQTVL